MRIELQSAYVLHTRAYRDTSLLVDFFTPTYGRLAAVARGVRQKKSRTRALLNPFTRLLVSLQGKTDLKLLTAVEADGCYYDLQGEQLYSGFYLNELLVRLLPEMDAHENLFRHYQESLLRLQHGAELEPVLRNFELTLLDELGYGVDFTRDALTAELIAAERHYCFDHQRGFIASPQVTAGGLVFSGDVIGSIEKRNFSNEVTRMCAKQLCRQMLNPLLGNRPLKSRELFIKNNC